MPKCFRHKAVDATAVVSAHDIDHVKKLGGQEGGAFNQFAVHVQHEQ